MTNQQDKYQRAILPVPDRPHMGLTTCDAKDPNTKFPPIEPVQPPEGAPNVLVVLIDDVGFGASSTFGGPCETPNFERLANGGLRYNRFHTTALCAPTRAALLTGRSHHSVGMGGITEIATSAPGYNLLRPNTKAPLAQTLQMNAYSTSQLGKCHEVPVWQTSPMGPFDMWPTGSGFEHFYGFIGGEDNQWYPALYKGTTPVEPPKTPEEGYHLTEDLADHAVNWVRSQEALMPDKPFFMYFAPGATHAPHHVPKEWIERYEGKFAHGWDEQREITFARQKEMGSSRRTRS
jgi:arylsulfatase A-like enzyme